MRSAIPALCVLLAAAGVGPAGEPPGPCEPGYRWVEEDSCEEVVRYVCKLVPGVKKVRKIVYVTKDDPFCLRRSGLKALCGDGCPTCKGPYDRKTLVKTEIVTEEPTTKCVTEKVTRKVPCKVWRKVPCEK